MNTGTLTVLSNLSPLLGTICLKNIFYRNNFGMELLRVDVTAATIFPWSLRALEKTAPLNSSCSNFCPGLIVSTLSNRPRAWLCKPIREQPSYHCTKLERIAVSAAGVITDYSVKYCKTWAILNPEDVLLADLDQEEDETVIDGE